MQADAEEGLFRTQDTLAAFAQHTRMSDEDRANVTSLAQKWLACHINVADTAAVYRHIGTDYPLLKLRTRNPKLSSYQENAPDPAPLVYVMRHGLPNVRDAGPAVDGPTYQAFRDVAFPRPVGEESWVSQQASQQHWKQRAFFVALNFRSSPSFPRIVEAIFAEDVGAEERATARYKLALENTFNALKRVQLVNVDPSELGQLIAQIQLQDSALAKLGCGMCDAHETGEREPTSSSRQQQQDEALDAKIKIVLQNVSVGQEEVDWEALRREPAYEQYRRSAGLAPTFSAPKVAKQMLLSALGFRGSEPEARAVMSRNQTQLAPVEAATVLPMLERHVLERVPALGAQLDLEDDALQSFYVGADLDKTRQQAWTTHDFVCSLVRMYAGVPQRDRDNDVRTSKRLLKRHPNVPATVVSSLLLSF